MTKTLILTLVYLYSLFRVHIFIKLKVIQFSNFQHLVFNFFNLIFSLKKKRKEKCGIKSLKERYRNNWPWIKIHLIYI